MNFGTTNLTHAGTTDPTGEARLEHLAEVMNINSVQQHQFAVLLRRLADRLPAKSTQGAAFRKAYQAARNKELRLRIMVDELDFEPCKPRRRNLSFRIYFWLANSAPVPLMVWLLSIGVSKRVRAHLLDRLTRRPRAGGLLNLPTNSRTRATPPQKAISKL